MVILMKKIFAILVSLLFVVSVFGVASTMAGECPNPVASPDVVKVGELITLTSTCYYGNDPIIIADGDKPKGDAELVSRPEKTSAKGLFPVEEPTYTWVYRATAAGTIKFDFTIETAFIRPEPEHSVSNPVTITAQSYPMFKFMKILGFGNESA